jgi:hypothetical protein
MAMVYTITQIAVKIHDYIVESEKHLREREIGVSAMILHHFLHYLAITEEATVDTKLDVIEKSEP